MTADDRFARFGESNSVSRALEVLRRRWLIVAGVVLVCTALSALQQHRAAKSYNATARVAFQNSTLSEAALQVGSSGSGEPQREANTQVDIAHSPEVAVAVLKQLGGQLGVEELLKLVSVEPAANADVLEVTASTGNPFFSAKLANAFANQYIAFRATSQLSSIDAAQTRLEQQIAAMPAGSPERTLLEQSVQRLGELRAVAGGGANIIGRATPPGQASGMRLSTAVIIGLLIGLALAFSLVFVLESIDRRIKSIEEFEEEYRLTALAVVPQAAMRPSRADERTGLLEPYRILRSGLDFAAVTRPLDTLLVTSAVPGEGKTTVCVDLAHAIALTGRRVVLIELDLRMPTFERHFGLNRNRGVTTALVGSQAPVELLVEPLLDLPNLSVLPAGPIPHNPSELLASPAIGEIISELSARGSMVIIDAAPLNPVADAQILLSSEAINATLIVARLETTTRDQVRRARTILDRHMVEPVGLMITGVREGGGYGYAYGEYEMGANGLDADAVSRRSSAAARKPLKL